MPLRRLSIQWKITLLAGLCLAGIVTLLVGLSLYRMDHSSDLVKASSMQMLTEAAQSRIESQGEVQALNIRRQFMDAYQYGNGFARMVQVLKARGGSDRRAERKMLWIVFVVYAPFPGLLFWAWRGPRAVKGRAVLQEK